MKLVVENYPEGEGLLRQAFNITCNRLGIASEKWTVTLRFNPQSAMVDDFTDGQTKSTSHNGQCYMELTTNLLKGDTFRLIQVFCHELVHVKQIIKDGLRGTPRGMEFRGELYPIQVLAFASILPFPAEPWEVEAYSRDTELAKTVMQFVSL